MRKPYTTIDISNIDQLQDELKKALELSDQLKDSLKKINSWIPDEKNIRNPY